LTALYEKKSKKYIEIAEKEYKKSTIHELRSKKRSRDDFGLSQDELG
jgi:hypothetical protein